jgi:hypothetical protein
MRFSAPYPGTADRYPQMAACRERRRVPAMKTRGRCGAILDARIDAHPTLGGCGMRQVRITKQRRTADSRWRRRREPVLPLDPRDPEVTGAKQLQRRRGLGTSP